MSKSNFYAELERRAGRAIFLQSFYRWESGVIIGLTVALCLLTLAGVVPVLFGLLDWWFWLALGLVGEAAFLWSSVRDPAFRERAVDRMFRQTFDPGQIRDEGLRQQVDKALEYRKRIEEAIERGREGVLQSHLRDASRDITRWLESVFRLARRLDSYQNDPVIRQDRQDVGPAIDTLKRRLATEEDPTVQRQISQAIAQRQIQRDNLAKLQNVMEQAQFQLESTITAIATVYSQMMILGARDVASGRARRLQQEIADQVQALQDVVQTLDQVYRTRGDALNGSASPGP
jgi:hypothetical protein